MNVHTKQNSTRLVSFFVVKKLETWKFPHKFYKCKDGQLPSPEEMQDILEHLACTVEDQFKIGI